MIISRGRGRGHAVPDMAIAAALGGLVPNLRLQFVSYAAGADAYRACGHQVLDLQAPDNPPFLDMIIAFTRLLGKAKPHLVVAHEEVPVVPVAEAFKIPCLFITDFFSDPNSIAMQALRYADEIVFTAQRGLYTEPPYLKGKVHYVGRAVRHFEYTPADRGRARCELDIPQDATVVLCQPGTWTESQMPLVDLLSSAWTLVGCSPKLLIWLAGRDYQALAARFGEQPHIRVLKEDWKIDRLMAASNVVLSKANRVTVYEAAAMGLPSISVTKFVNWPDDVAVQDVESNTHLFANSVTPELLSKLIMEKAGSKPRPATALSDGIAGAAARIAYRIDLIRQSVGSKTGAATQRSSWNSYRTWWDRYAANWERSKVFVEDRTISPSEKETYLQHLGDEWGKASDVTTIVSEYILPYITTEAIAAEIGSGGGRLASKVASRVKELVCFDISNEMIKKCRTALQAYGNLKFVLLEAPEFASGFRSVFDFVYAFDVFVHLDLHTMWQYFQQICEILKPTGRVFIHTTNLRAPEGWNKFLRQGMYEPGGAHYFISPEIVHILADHAGLRTVKHSTTDPGNFYLARDYFAVFEK